MLFHSYHTVVTPLQAELLCAPYLASLALQPLLDTHLADLKVHCYTIVTVLLHCCENVVTLL
jgi:hypothetical protein